jgi:alpha-tubulin suppressor-like RCC1 family protein
VNVRRVRVLAFVGVLGLIGCSDGDAEEASAAPIAGPDAPIGTPPSGPVSAGAAKLDCGGHGCAVKQIALGTIAACALLEDATVACYGGGIVGTLGRGDRPEIDPVPKRVPNLKNVAHVFGGGYSMCALLTDKTVTCWGPDQSANPYGARPGDLFAVPNLANVVELAVATSHTCARLESGDVHCFGSNYFGELGDGTTNNSKMPVKAAAISGAKQIATGAELSCAVLSNGSVSCWGLNDQGQLGQGDVDKLIHPAPVTVPGLDGPAKSVAASSISGAVCALLESGSTKCWGEKLAGDPAASARASALALGWSHACVLGADGTVACWGANTKGQLGSDPGRAAVGLTTGGHSSCAVFGDGAFACWGDDSRGQLGGGRTGTTRALPELTHF